jgi:Xaa-Pro aminopeptidase
MEPVFARAKFSKPVYEKAAHRLVETGGGIFSHPVGLAVHDDGDYSRGPLRPGHVIAFDPQLRVPEENLYIRYEDLLVITENGYENLTVAAPARLEDIEKLVQQGGGVLQKVPPLERAASEKWREPERCRKLQCGRPPACLSSKIIQRPMFAG